MVVPLLSRFPGKKRASTPAAGEIDAHVRTLIDSAYWMRYLDRRKGSSTDDTSCRGAPVALGCPACDGLPAPADDQGHKKRRRSPLVLPQTTSHETYTPKLPRTILHHIPRTIKPMAALFSSPSLKILERLPPLRTRPAARRE